MLKMGTLGDQDKQCEGLQSLLDDVTGRKHELETEVRSVVSSQQAVARVTLLSDKLTDLLYR